jgi:MFS family permease
MEKNEVKKTVLFVTLIASFLAPFMSSSINVALPSIGKELGLDAILLSWVSSAFLLSSAVFLVPLGKIAEYFWEEENIFFGNFNLHYFFFSLFYFKIWKFSHFFSCIPRNWGSNDFWDECSSFEFCVFTRRKRKGFRIQFCSSLFGAVFWSFLGRIFNEKFWMAKHFLF